MFDGHFDAIFYLGAVLNFQIMFAQSHVQSLSHTMGSRYHPDWRDESAAAERLFEPIEYRHLPRPLTLSCTLTANDPQHVRQQRGLALTTRRRDAALVIAHRVRPA